MEESSNKKIGKMIYIIVVSVIVEMPTAETMFSNRPEYGTIMGSDPV